PPCDSSSGEPQVCQRRTRPRNKQETDFSDPVFREATGYDLVRTGVRLPSVHVLDCSHLIEPLDKAPRGILDTDWLSAARRSRLRSRFLGCWQFGDVGNAVFVLDELPMGIQAEVSGTVWKWPSRPDDNLSSSTEASIDARREIHFTIVWHTYFSVPN